MPRSFPILRHCAALLFLLAASTCVAQLNISSVQSGPMVGYSDMTEVLLWVQTTKKASVQFRYWTEADPKKKSSTDPVITGKENAFVARVRIEELVPGTRYGYEVMVDGKLITRPYPLRFQTQTLWQWRTDPPAFTAAVGSCFYINETAWDRPGKPYGSDYGIAGTIAAQEPDLMIWLGDNTYYREVDWNSVSGLKRRWTHTRSQRELQPLLGSVHNYYIWDDHDFGPDDSDRSYRLRTEALDVFKLFTANQTYGTLETPGIFSRFEWADAEFILLDDRFHRSPNRTSEGPDKTMWGTEQVQWLKDALLNSRSPFKIVLNGNQVLNPICPYEGLIQFRSEYDDLLGFIRANRITGVVFVSGDRHMSELIKLEDSTFYPLYDFTSSSLTAGLAPPRGAEVNNPYRVPGSLVADAHNFGLLKFTGPRTDRVLTIECRDTVGTLRWSHKIRASDLRPPALAR